MMPGRLGQIKSTFRAWSLSFALKKLWGNPDRVIFLKRQHLFSRLMDRLRKITVMGNTFESVIEEAFT